VQTEGNATCTVVLKILTGKPLTRGCIITRTVLGNARSLTFLSGFDVAHDVKRSDQSALDQPFVCLVSMLASSTVLTMISKIMARPCRG
jgi:hypothetical protein